MARLYIHQVTGIPLILMSNKGDPPHAAQKVFQDIVEHGSFATVSADATFIADKFKNTRLKQFLKEELEISDGRWSSNMPVITRWGSHLKMYTTLVKCKEEFECVLRNPEATGHIHKDLPGKVFSRQFWIDLNALIDVVKPIGEAIVELEKDSCISNVFKIWSELETLYCPQTLSNISTDIKRFVLAKLRERWNLIQDPIHTISYFFDPRFRQQMISEQLRRNVTTVIKKV